MKEGWEMKKLGDVCETGSGGTPLKAHKDYYEGGIIPWLLSGEVSQGEVFEAKNFITEKGLKNSSAKLFPINTVLVAMYGATAGQVGILKFEACTNQAVCGILPNSKTIPEFIFFCFLSKKEELIAQAVGGAQPNISQIKVRNTKIPVPPLPEQQRIVAILDETFAAIAKAKANAEQNLKNAKELFECYLQGVFENKGEDWTHTRLGDVCKINDGTHFSPKNTSDGAYMYVTAKNIKPYFIDLTKISYISEKDHKEIYARCSPVKGDVLYIKDGATAGIAAMNTLDNEFSLLSSVALLKCSPKILNTFLVHYMNSSIGRKNFLGYIGGAAITRLTLIKIKNVCFLLPPIKVQQAIVQKLDALSTETKRLEIIYQNKINDLEDLKKSVLQKAFNGELKMVD